MEWRHVRHVPVEDDDGRLVGLVTHRALLHLLSRAPAQTEQPLTVRDIMKTNPLTVSSTTPTLDALEIMQANRVGCLPVVDDGRLVRILPLTIFSPEPRDCSGSNWAKRHRPTTKPKPGMPNAVSGLTHSLFLFNRTGLPKKWYGGKRQANTGSAGALARYEREARNSYSVKRFEIERAAHAGRARAPALPVLTGSFQIGSTFWAKPTEHKVRGKRDGRFVHRFWPHKCGL